jgi:peptidoglycan/LPS O-acetylase OafA/YrhL
MHVCQSQHYTDTDNQTEFKLAMFPSWRFVTDIQIVQKIKSLISNTAISPKNLVPSTNAQSRDYRPDIDGLRAIAVLSVVIFHAFPSLIQGGFVGVDIFFVISGYLISKHIWDELSAETLSIKVFYVRRVRRIFPALSVVLIACMVMGWLILTPGEYEQLGKHVVAGVLFVSNIIFWNEAGYFDNAADTKPLLHLWSLGVEEQFYIVWPLFLALFWRYSRHLSWAFIGVLCGSLGYSLMIVHHDSVADFYSPLTRFWELALGAGLAHLSSRNVTSHTVNRSVISLIGLLLILIAIVAINRNDAFPGAWALLPTLGAACLIFAGERAWPNRHVLSHPLMVWLGLISYPLYLWHWPLLSFARIIESATPSSNTRVGLLAASIALAWLTYQLIERPIRSRARSWKIVLILCIGMTLIGAAGLTVKKLSGFKFRLSSMLNGQTDTMALGVDRENLIHECGISDAKKPIFQYCLQTSTNEPHYALLGDSKAEALFYGLVRESKPDMQWMMIGSVYPPVDNLAVIDQQQLKNRLALQTVISNQSIKIVALTMALRGIFPVSSETGFIPTNIAPPLEQLSAFSSMIRQLENAGKHVVFIIDNPTFPDPTSCIGGGVTSNTFLNQFLRRKENPHCTIRYDEQLSGTYAYQLFVDKLKSLHPNLTVYNPTPLLCDIPHNLCTITHNGKFLYSYGDHISDYANSMIARDMLPIIRKLAE